MSIEKQILLVAIAIVILLIISIVLTKLPKPLRTKYFLSRWRALQKYCKDKSTWPQALKEADRLMDNALKKRKFKGKTTGERMVSAQRILTDNDGAWFAHNIYKKIIADPGFKLRESDVKDALVSYRQVLRDLGALPSDAKSRDS